MQRQNILDLPPRGAGSWPGSEERYSPLPGRVVLESLKIPETSTGILYTDNLKHYCDVARVTASGVMELSKGQLVLLMAGVGMYLGDGLEGRIVGTGRWKQGGPDPWDYCIPARLEGYHWVLSPGWCWASKVKESGLLLTANRLDKYRVHCQEVLGYDGEPQIMTEADIRDRGWELFKMLRPGGFERYLVLTQ